MAPITETTETAAMSMEAKTKLHTPSNDINVTNIEAGKQKDLVHKASSKIDPTFDSVDSSGGTIKSISEYHSIEPTSISGTLAADVSMPAELPSNVPIETIAKKTIGKKQRVEASAISLNEIDNLPVARRHTIDEVFDAQGTIVYEDWSPKLSGNKDAIHLLSGMGLAMNQTIAIKMSLNPARGRWSVNICPEDHKMQSDIFLHFNPRFTNSELILNDKQGTWGASVKRQLTGVLKSLRVISLQLIIQIREDGFYLFANKTFIIMYPHRRDPFQSTFLNLIIPATDGMGQPEQITVHQIWVGRVLERELNVSLYIPPSDGLPVREYRWKQHIKITNLPLETDPVEIYEIEKALYTLFEEFKLGMYAVTVTECGIAYVKVSEDMSVVEDAIQKLNGSLFAGEYVLNLSKCE